MTGIWDAVVEAFSAAGPAHETRSRYADKPALVIGRREVAHLETPDTVDVRLTRAGWLALDEALRTDPRVHHDPTRRDWVGLRLASSDDVLALAPLLRLAATLNA